MTSNFWWLLLNWPQDCSGGWLLVLGLKEFLVECATVCVKSEVILFDMCYMYILLHSHYEQFWKLLTKNYPVLSQNSNACDTCDIYDPDFDIQCCYFGWMFVKDRMYSIALKCLQLYCQWFKSVLENLIDFWSILTSSGRLF